MEDRIEGSVFVTTLARASTVADARDAIQRVRDEFPDATHHCFAYVVGSPGSSAATAAADDGEPAGTAGRPMLSVLMNSGVGDVVVVVTRWFGGVKLGKGGLVRAYTGGVQHVLREAPTVVRVDHVELRVTLPYPALDAVRRALEREGARVTADAFEERVTLTVSAPEDRVDALRQALLDASSGQARIEDST